MAVLLNVQIVCLRKGDIADFISTAGAPNSTVGGGLKDKGDDILQQTVVTNRLIMLLENSRLAGPYSMDDNRHTVACNSFCLPAR